MLDCVLFLLFSHVGFRPWKFMDAQEVTYRLGGNFWPSRASAKLHGDPLAARGRWLYPTVGLVNLNNYHQKTIGGFLKWGIPQNYFTSCDPHHDIYPFCFWQIFWHSIWHIFWHSIWHSIWPYFLVFYLAHLLAFYLAYLLTFYLAYLLAFYLTNLLAFSLAYLLGILFGISSNILLSGWHSIWHISWHIFWPIWHSIWHIFWHSIWPLRSSGAHWAGKVPGWGRAVHTELGRSQVEVQRCTLSWGGPRLRSSGAHGPRLRSSGAHWAGEVPGWGPAVRTELGSWQRAWRRVGKAELEVEVDADIVEAKQAEEAEEEKGEEEEEEEKEEEEKS